MIESKINSFDFDGVISLGIYPSENDVIITGRSFEEEEETERFLLNRGIKCLVFYNPLPFHLKTRISSAQHKVNVINRLGNIKYHFEDDPLQEAHIKKHTSCTVIKITQHEVGLENERRNDID